MLTVVIDYGVGNLHSAEKAFQRMAAEAGGGEVLVSSRAQDVARADRLVLPGDGAFAHCRETLAGMDGLEEAITEAIITRGRPFLGICVGMQLLATWGRENRDAAGFGWIAGEVARITPDDPLLKVPHMGWNDLVIDQPHPVLAGLTLGDHAYFVHSYQYRVDDPGHCLAHCDYGGPIAAVVGRDNLVGTQFHPEKSQAAGLRLISNFLTWAP